MELFRYTPITAYFLSISLFLFFFLYFAGVQSIFVSFSMITFKAKQFYTFFTAPFCNYGIIGVCNFILLYFYGTTIENRISSDNFFKLLINIYLLFVVISIIFFLANTNPFITPSILGSSAINCFLSGLTARAFPNLNVNFLYMNIRSPIISFIVFITYTGFKQGRMTLEVIGFILGYLSPSIMPSLLEPIGTIEGPFWMKKPKKERKPKFGNKGRTLND